MATSEARADAASRNGALAPSIATGGEAEREDGNGDHFNHLFSSSCGSERNPAGSRSKGTQTSSTGEKLP